MLALKSYEQTNGFSVMDADELFFIVGGEGEGDGNQSDNKGNETTYEVKMEADGSLEYDEKSGQAKGSASAKISYGVSGTK